IARHRSLGPLGRRRTRLASASLGFGPAVAQSHRAVEDRASGPGIAVAAEITLALELDRPLGLVLGKRGLDHGILQHLERRGIEVGHDIATGAGIGTRKESAVEPDLRWYGVRCRYPVDRALHLAAVGRVAAARRRVVGAAQLHYLARGVLHCLAAGNEIGEAQPHLAAGREPIELLGRVLHEIVALDIELAAKSDAASSG